MTSLSIELTRRVQNGVALLDLDTPGWRSRIRIDTLNLKYPCECVIGQVYGNYDSWLSTNMHCDVATSIEHGFTLREAEFKAGWQTEWKKVWLDELQKKPR